MRGSKFLLDRQRLSTGKPTHQAHPKPGVTVMCCVSGDHSDCTYGGSSGAEDLYRWQEVTRNKAGAMLDPHQHWETGRLLSVKRS
ncbi:hypothetical protein QQF64_007309 [Cirrhinus molitorella]|uniref:MHC class I antigen n=1 Tax=Cirrhinus molitorella TaxID=172907 RepID=A0ABR3MDE8_9TELE